MASIGELLKHEISRLSRRELRSSLEPIRKAVTTYRRDIAALKREVAALKKQVDTQRRVVMPTVKSAPDDVPLRFVAKGLRTLRDRFGMSAADFGLLVGIGGQTVLNWENKKSVPSREQVAQIAALRPLGKRDAVARLEVAKAANAGKQPRKRRKRG
jgi:DNA-binding transcriptional regulator YiaG